VYLHILFFMSSARAAGESWLFPLIDSKIQYNTMNYNTIQYNAMQCNAMQYNLWLRIFAFRNIFVIIVKTRNCESCK
jgi:hypothetical protein